MKKKGAPKSMIKHEESEMKGRKMPKFAAGGPSLSERMKAREEAYRKATSVESRAAAQRAARGLAPRNPSKPAYTMDDYRKDFPSKKPAPPAARPAAPSGGAAMPVSGMGAAGGTTQTMMRKGGSVFRKGADGKAHKGKTKGTMVKMREGGSVFRKGADGIASKGKTKGKVVKMAYGGKC